jgi:hypothetical protein
MNTMMTVSIPVIDGNFSTSCAPVSKKDSCLWDSMLFVVTVNVSFQQVFVLVLCKKNNKFMDTFSK